MRYILPATLALAALLTGCGGEPEAPVLPPAPATQPQTVDITQNVPPPAPAPDATAVVAAAPAQVQVSESEPLGGKGRPLTPDEVMLINYGVSMFKEEKGRFPANLQEAVASRHISRLPQLPAGEKFVYDSQTGSVKVETAN